MNWKNIKQDLCPKCSQPLIINEEDERVRCEREVDSNDEYANCFIMEIGAFFKLKNKMLDQDALKKFEHDNSEALNNL